MSSQQQIIIGIRREDKSIWERRASLTPEDIQQLLLENPNIKFIVQPSETRIFSNFEYEQVGAIIKEELYECQVILGVREIPRDKLLKNKTYLFFSDTTKAQVNNMKMLDCILEKNIRLIDYEKIQDGNNTRLITFGKLAGISSCINFLSGLGLFLLTKNIASPFINISLTHKYFSIEQAYQQLKMVSKIFQKQGITPSLRPLIFAIIGNGRCAQGTLEVLQNFPIKIVSPDDLQLICADKNNQEHGKYIYVAQFKHQNIVENQGYYQDNNNTHNNEFNKSHYYQFPYEYTPIFHNKYLPYISVIFQNMQWEKKFPRLITDQQLQQIVPLKLLGICDVSCMKEGAIQCVKKITTPECPFNVVDIVQNKVYDGPAYRKNGIIFLNMEDLARDLAYDASIYLSDKVKKFIINISQGSFVQNFQESQLEECIKKAVVTDCGKLTNCYKYIQKLRMWNEDIQQQDYDHNNNKGISNNMTKSMSFSSIKIEGHIFNTQSINKIMSVCQNQNIKFNIAEIYAGQTDEEKSSFILQLFGECQDVMMQVLEEIEKMAQKFEFSIEESHYPVH